MKLLNASLGEGPRFTEQHLIEIHVKTQPATIQLVAQMNVSRFELGRVKLKHAGGLLPGPLIPSVGQHHPAYIPKHYGNVSHDVSSQAID